MLTLHLLEHSRALRIVWLLEALGTEYELVRYLRTQDGRAPPDLTQAHPLGKSPVIVDGTLRLAESATILRYIHDTYGDGRFAPQKGTTDHAVHEEWLDFVESSAMFPVLVTLLEKIRGGVGETMTGMAAAQVPRMLDYIAGGVAAKPFLMGDTVMLADIQISYLLAIAEAAGLLGDHPEVAAYWQRLQDDAGFRRAVDIGGEPVPPALRGGA